MARAQTWRARRIRALHRVHARLAARARVPTGFVSQPEPRTIGHFAKGRQLVAGNFLFSGELIEAPGQSIWEIAVTHPAVIDDLHGFAWLDDLAAVADAKARDRAQTWIADWIARYGGGSGPGWTPDLTGRRLIRWINHGFLVLRGRDKPWSDAFYRSLARQTVFLSRRWRTARPGLPRFEALTGMIYAGLSLQGMDRHVAPAIAALAQECTAQIDPRGGLPTRNPEELLEVFTLLTWAAAAITEAGQQPPDPVMAALHRIAPTLRALRHADGGLARFHGGGRGIEGRLDAALAASGVKDWPDEGLHMGFARLAAGRTTVIVDAARPPQAEASYDAHASTLAFELTSGRRPMIVNSGSGARFGDEWRRAGRATASHSTLAITGYSSSRLGLASRLSGFRHELLAEGPDTVLAERSVLPDGVRIELAHNGYQRTHGLTHARTFDMAVDGRALAGEDLLTTLSDGDKARFDRALDAAGLNGVPFSIAFHLHPEVEAQLDLGGAAVSLTLRSGEVWIFRHDGSAQMRLDPSVYLENGRLKPRATQQVVLTARAMSYATRVRWSLAKAQETPISLRDLAPETGANGDDD